MPATLAHRRKLLTFALALFALAFAAVPFSGGSEHGIPYLLYLPIALVGLATSPLAGAATGLATALLYGLEFAAAHTGSEYEAMTVGGALLLVTYAAIGALVGKFAQDHRRFAARLTMLADRDSLTGLLNARAHEAAVAQRLAAGQPFALVLADMDGLKELNDAHGHVAGNEALVQLATALAGAVRRHDTVARIGGDEFAILVGDANARDAHLLCRRLESTLAPRSLAVSLGWSSWPDDALNPRGLFERADERLYEHKATRRAAEAAAGSAHSRPAGPLV